jgi:hypothetical protein
MTLPRNYPESVENARALGISILSGTITLDEAEWLVSVLQECVASRRTKIAPRLSFQARLQAIEQLIASAVLNAPKS